MSECVWGGGGAGECVSGVVVVVVVSDCECVWGGGGGGE